MLYYKNNSFDLNMHQSELAVIIQGGVSPDSA